MANLDTAAKRHAGLVLRQRRPPRPSGLDADTSLERGQLVGMYGAAVGAATVGAGIGNQVLTFRTDQRITVKT